MTLTIYTSLTYIWVLCLGCERANGGNAPIVHTSLTYICVLCLGCERANRVNASIVEPLSRLFSWRVFCFLSLYVLIKMFIDPPFFCLFGLLLFLCVCYLAARTSWTAHTCGWTFAAWHEISRVIPNSRVHMSNRAPLTYGLVISFRLPFPYIQTQECLVSN